MGKINCCCIVMKILKDKMYLSNLTFSHGGIQQKSCLLLWVSLASYCSKVIVWEMKDNLLSLRKIGKRFLLIPIMTWINAPFILTLLKVLLWTEPILEFKESIQHNQKGLPTSVTQVDLILQSWREFKVLVTICF